MDAEYARNGTYRELYNSEGQQLKITTLQIEFLIRRD
jgi:hypothetical protein